MASTVYALLVVHCTCMSMFCGRWEFLRGGGGGIFPFWDCSDVVGMEGDVVF